MEKRDTRLFQHYEPSWNIVELEVLESRRQLHQKVNELIRLAHNASLTTSEIRHQLLLGAATFGHRLTMRLVHSLHRDSHDERQSIVWLLTLLNDREAITSLQHMSRNERLPRLVRLSASLTLAGMGATAEMIEDKHARLYAIS
jgi:hypothetical protein